MREDESFYKFIKQLCLTELNDIQILVLEAVKFWATKHNIVKYIELCDLLLKSGIDLPNELAFFREKTD